MADNGFFAYLPFLLHCDKAQSTTPFRVWCFAVDVGCERERYGLGEFSPYINSFRRIYRSKL